MSNDISELKRAEFPQCVSQGLQRLEDLLKLPPASHHLSTQQHIIDSYIFYFRESGTSKLKAMGPIEELVMVRELSQYLVHMTDPGGRNSLFITLFHLETHDPRTPLRLKILSSLVSLAVSTHNVAVLEATAVWMQQVCCLSVWCGEVCKGLVQDYFQAGSNTPPHFFTALRSLPSATPLFTANLITALAQLYAKLGTDEPYTEPPKSLVSMIVWWLRNNASLALTSLTHTLPGVSLPMTAVPPVTPLIKWCVEAPLLESENSKCNVIHEEKRDASAPEDTDLYSELHFSLLQILQCVPSLRPQMTQRQVLSPKHMTSIVEGVFRRINKCKVSDNARQVSLNRLSQIILVAISTECLTGALNDMWSILRRLPRNNRLLTILLTSSESL